MISIIVPIYKAEKTLPRCIDSILAQTYTDFELLLIDDGSPDRCGEICDEYAAKDSRIRVFHNENGGVSRARNCGMDNMRGEYFICVDSDDEIKPCHIKDLVSAKEAHPDLGHVLCGFYCVSQNKDYILTDAEELSIVDRKDYMRLADHVLTQSTWRQLYSADTVNKNNLRMREDLSLAEDLLFNLEYFDALENTSIGVINKANYIYQDESNDSLAHKYRPDLKKINEITDIAIRHYLHKWEITDEYSWQKYYDGVFFGTVNLLDNTFRKENKMTLAEKIIFNSKAMKNEAFQKVLRNNITYISPKLKKAYESGNYLCVMALNTASKIKHKLIK